MTTIVVHGTMTVSSAIKMRWWWDSWYPGGFLNAVADAMTEVSGSHDVWHVGGRPVSDWPELNPKRNIWIGRIGQIVQYRGHFIWSGADMYSARDAAAGQLAKYLNVITDIAGDEPLRIIAHSHGCNVVKLASSRKNLSTSVFIDRAVFLACPHFESQGHDGPVYPYQLDPGRFGEILNLYSNSDSVQVGFADTLPGPAGWRMTDFLPPKAYRVEQDPQAVHLYRDYEIPTIDQGVKAHTALHGDSIGYLSGGWLLTGIDLRDALSQADLFPVPSGDFGE